MKSVSDELQIREFHSGDAEAFRRLNEEWITHHFQLESKDRETLDDPQRAILDQGGRIFFATLAGQVVGCCALVAMAPGQFELAKMAVTESARGAGIGRALLQAVIDEARTARVQRLYLESNSALGPALKLYEAAGFRHLPADRRVASPYARADVQMELLLE